MPLVIVDYRSYLTMLFCFSPTIVQLVNIMFMLFGISFHHGIALLPTSYNGISPLLPTSCNGVLSICTLHIISIPAIISNMRQMTCGNQSSLANVQCWVGLLQQNLDFRSIERLLCIQCDPLPLVFSKI